MNLLHGVRRNIVYCTFPREMLLGGADPCDPQHGLVWILMFQER